MILREEKSVTKNSKLGFRTIVLALIVLVVLVVIFSSYTIIDPGHRGIVVMLGRVEDTVLGEGFHLVLPPMVRRVVQMDVRTKKLEVTTEAATFDMQAMQVTVVLNYHPLPSEASNLYREVGMDYESVIILPALHEAVKAATARLRIDKVLSERSQLKEVVRNSLSERLERNNIVVDEVSLANIEFSQEFDNAIEQKQVAEQRALAKEYELQAARKDVEIRLAQAEGEKQAAIIDAEGKAEARKLEAQAEAEALSLIAQELRGNSDLIRYEWATRLSPGVSTVLLPADQEIILGADSLVSSTPGTGAGE